VRGGWRRLLVKARPSDKFPKPKLKFLLPLTQTIDSPSDAAAEQFADFVPISTFLVMLEEQWGESAGFAEKLVAKVSRWQDDVKKVANARAGREGKTVPEPPDTPNPINEIGIDGIVSNASPDDGPSTSRRFKWAPGQSA
jgi:hypothetical protein